jgi:hypothetical protein
MSFLSSASGALPEPAPESIAEAAIESAAPVEAAPAPIDEALARAAREREDLALFIGVNVGAFVGTADAGGAMSSRAGAICWPGLLLPTPWFLYRKMYGFAAITVFTPVLFSLVHVPAEPLRWIGMASTVLGAFGKRLYRAKARRTIAAIRAAAPDEASAREAIARAGGVSRAGAAFGFLLLLAFLAFAFLKS